MCSHLAAFHLSARQTVEEKAFYTLMSVKWEVLSAKRLELLVFVLISYEGWRCDFRDNTSTSSRLLLLLPTAAIYFFLKRINFERAWHVKKRNVPIRVLQIHITSHLISSLFLFWGRQMKSFLLIFIPNFLRIIFPITLNDRQFWTLKDSYQGLNKRQKRERKRDEG
jgi:hypothetical protein